MGAKLTVADLQALAAAGEKIVMATAGDAVAGALVDQAGVDGVIVGDAVAKVMLGYASPDDVTCEDMLVLAAATARGVERALVTVDLPSGSYESSDDQAVETARRFVSAGGDAVKLEPDRTAASRARAIVAAGVPVMGHLGLSSQAISQGARDAQATTVAAARRLVEDALELQEAGVFALLIEAIAGPVTKLLTDLLAIPTLGVGCGPDASGQVLGWPDLVGLRVPPPRWAKTYAQVPPVVLDGVRRYVEEVRAGTFPGEGQTFPAPPEVVEELREAVQAL